MATKRNNAATEPAERELVITRVFDAPRELVFKAWTEPERLMRWWGPKDSTTPFCTVDLRKGGVFHYCMRSPEGRNIGALVSIAKSFGPNGSSAPTPLRMRKATLSRLHTTE